MAGKHTCRVCGETFHAYVPQAKYCSGPCAVEARRRRARERNAKFRRNNIHNRARGINPHWHRAGPRKRILVPGREVAEREVEAMALEAEAERIRRGSPDPWE
jgi:hypothetical protein